MRLWRKSDVAPEGKYLVQRRDGTVPEWPWFVLGARDPNAVVALLAYAAAAEAAELDPDYVADIRTMAYEWEKYRRKHGVGDPDGKPHRKDDPSIIAKMAKAHGS